ncbi:alkaline phosphatase family protein [soil metagenome]
MIVTRETDPVPHRPSRRPNILLITLDQFRAECLGSAGHPLVQTPNLDRLAAQGVRFANHFSNCAPCAPARASLLTGLWQSNHRVTNNGAPLSDALPMLPRQLRAAGYDPTLFGYTDTALDPATLDADDPRRTSYEEPMPGFALGVALTDDIGPWIEWLAVHGYDRPEHHGDIYEPADIDIPEGRGASWRPTRYAAEHSEAAFLTEAALEWLGSPDRGTDPWCAHVSYLRPHPPYIVPAPYNDMFDPADVAPPVRQPTPEDEAAVHPFLAGALAIVPSPADDLDQRQLQATYYGMIAEVDHWVGELLDGFDRLGAADDTIVVLTADHGEQLGDHWLVEKMGFFDQSYRIPLIIRSPALIHEPGRVVDAFTEAVDIAPTLLDLSGVDPSGFCDGASLRAFLEAPHEPPSRWREAVHWEYDFREPGSDLIEVIFGIRQDQCALSVIRDRHGKYVQFAGGLAPLFFDLDDDPGELHDLVRATADDRPGEVSARLFDYAQRLLVLLMEHTDPRLANTRATGFGTVYRSDPPRF